MDFVKGKLVNYDKPYKEYLRNKILLLGNIFGQYELLAISGEDGLKGLCEYVWNNDEAARGEYETLEGFTEEVELGNDGFGFDYEEIERVD